MNNTLLSFFRIEKNLNLIEKAKFNLSGSFAQFQKIILCYLYKIYFCTINSKDIKSDEKQLYTTRVNIYALIEDNFKRGTLTIKEQIKEGISCCNKEDCGFVLRQKSIHVELNFIEKIIDEVHKNMRFAESDISTYSPLLCSSCCIEKYSTLITNLLEIFKFHNKNMFSLIEDQSIALKNFYLEKLKECTNKDCIIDFCLSCNLFQESHINLVKLRKFLATRSACVRN